MIEPEKIEEENGWIEWYEFLPSKDTFVVRTLPQKTKKATESGIILQTKEDSVVMDRPNAGIVVSVGPESKYKVGEFLFIQMGMGYDLEMVRKPTDVSWSYVLLYNDAIIGSKCKDTRK